MPSMRLMYAARSAASSVGALLRCVRRRPVLKPPSPMSDPPPCEGVGVPSPEGASRGGGGATTAPGTEGGAAQTATTRTDGS